VFYDENMVQIGAQSVPDLVAAGFPNLFVPDPGQTTIGTFYFTIFFTLGAANELVHFDIQAFPTQCSDDTSNFLLNSVFTNISTCAVPVTQGYTATVDMSGCPISGAVNYSYMYSVNGGPPLPGDTFDCIGYTGNVNVLFFIDNGVCPQEFMTTINCTGVGIAESGSVYFSSYPNPVNDSYYIEFYQEQPVKSVIVTDLAGRRVKELSSFDNVQKLEINTGDLFQGTYIYQVLFEYNINPVIGKFVKRD
jgi:hypothetical protein